MYLHRGVQHQKARRGGCGTWRNHSKSPTAGELFREINAREVARPAQGSDPFPEPNQIFRPGNVSDTETQDEEQEQEQEQDGEPSTVRGSGLPT